MVTVRRAEQGKRIIATYLRRMAETLGQPADRYVIEDVLEAASEYVVSLEGEWSGFFVESDRGVLPYVVQEDVELRQKGGGLEGSFTAYCPYEVRVEHLNDTRVINNVVFGTIRRTKWRPPDGLSTVVQVASRGNDWLEGFAVWYDADTDQAEVSRMITVRKNCPDYLQYMREARRIMESEVLLYRLRNLVEKGYDFGDAVAMVQAVEGQQPAAPALERHRAEGPDALRVEGPEYLARTGMSYEALLERLVELGHETLDEDMLGDDHEGTVEQWAPVFRDFPLCWRLLTKRDRIVGYWHFLPLKPERMEMARRGLLLDSTLTPQDVAPMDKPGHHSFYMVMMAVEPKYRFGASFKKILDSVFEAVELLAAERLFVDEIVFAAWTPMSRRLGERLNFQKIAELQGTASQGPDKAVPILATDLRDMLRLGEFDGYRSVRSAYDIR